MSSVWDNRKYKECLIHLQPEERDGAWIPRFTILCAQGTAQSHSLACEDAPQATRSAASDYAFERAKEWIDQN